MELTNKQKEHIINLYSKGFLDEAINESVKLSKEHKDNSFLYNMIACSYMAAGQYDKAVVNYEKLIEINSKDPAVFNNLATAYKQLGNIQSAIHNYKQAIILNQDYDQAYFNFASLLRDMGELKISESFLKEAVSINPSYVQAHNSLGNILKKQGKLKEALLSYKEAVKLKPNDENYISNLIDILIGLNLTEDKKIPLNCPDNLKCKTFILIYSFINKLFEKTDNTINELKNALKENKLAEYSHKDQKFIFPYLKFIDVLNTDIKEHQNDLCNQTQNNIIYHIGESHCLSFAHKNINFENKNHIIKPMIIIGAKAWHLQSDKTNSYKAFFENYLYSLKEGSKIILSFGEIDCRADEGIIRHHLKTKKSLEKIVEETVEGYINYAESHLNKMKRVYMGIPAPVVDTSKSLHDPLISLRIQTVKLFNEQLKKIADTNNLQVVDVYKITADKNGLSNMKHMCDSFHLDPSSLKYLDFHFS